jgi:hypothetical protein
MNGVVFACLCLQRKSQKSNPRLTFSILFFKKNYQMKYSNFKFIYIYIYFCFIFVCQSYNTAQNLNNENSPPLAPPPNKLFELFSFYNGYIPGTFELLKSETMSVGDAWVECQLSLAQEKCSAFTFYTGTNVCMNYFCV